MIVHIFSVKCSVSFNVLVVLFKAVLHKERSAQQYHHKRVRPSSCKNDYNARPRHQKLKRREKKQHLPEGKMGKG
jgi:hypothetical protein